MGRELILEGSCWKFGHNIPTDLITPTHLVFRELGEMAQHVLESANPEFPKKVQRGDIIVAGRNFGCSSVETVLLGDGEGEQVDTSQQGGIKW